jgi:hypothetical protein
MDEFSPAAGTIGLVRVPGVFGWLIGLGQLLAGDASRYTHAFVVLDDGTLIEAMPGGARIVPLSTWPAERVAYGWIIPLTERQRAAVVAAARSYEGVGYGFVDYAALALARFGVRPAWLRRFIGSSRRVICSQLVVQAYRDAGVELFADGRAAMEVTPGDLANLMVERDWGTAPAAGPVG